MEKQINGKSILFASNWGIKAKRQNRQPLQWLPVICAVIDTVKDFQSGGVLNECGHDLKKRLVQPRRAVFGNVPVLRFKGARQGGASTLAKATKDCLQSKGQTSPISAMSWGPRTGPTPNIPITTGYSGSCEVNMSISSWIPETVSMIVLSWSTARVTRRLTASTIGSVLTCEAAGAQMDAAFSSLNLYLALAHHFRYWFVNAFSVLPQTHSRCQNFAAKSTHFSYLAVSLEALLNRVLRPGKIPSISEVRLFLRLTFSFMYWPYWRRHVLSVCRI